MPRKYLLALFLFSLLVLSGFFIKDIVKENITNKIGSGVKILGMVVLDISKECNVDSDCSPNGNAITCDGMYLQRTYRCDINTYKCVGGKGIGTSIDCRNEYGDNYFCSKDTCVAKLRISTMK